MGAGGCFLKALSEQPDFLGSMQPSPTGHPPDMSDSSSLGHHPLRGAGKGLRFSYRGSPQPSAATIVPHSRQRRRQRVLRLLLAPHRPPAAARLSLSAGGGAGRGEKKAEHQHPLLLGGTDGSCRGPRQQVSPAPSGTPPQRMPCLGRVIIWHSPCPHPQLLIPFPIRLSSQRTY